jgi:hypothetical protein
MPSASVVATTPVDPHSPVGTWTIIGSRAPGISAMTEAQAASYTGHVVTYGAEQAIAGADTCRAATYHYRDAAVDSLLNFEYRITSKSLGLPDTAAKRIGVTRVSCGGQDWTSPGGTLLWLGAQRAFTVWDGVFFEMQRK